MGRRQEQGGKKVVKERAEWWRDIGLDQGLQHTKKKKKTKNKKLVMESVIHKKASSLSQSVRQAHYLQRHTHTPIKGILYILFTHTETHSSTRTHTSSQRNYGRRNIWQYLCWRWSQYVEALLPPDLHGKNKFKTNKTKKTRTHYNELLVTAAASASYSGWVVLRTQLRGLENKRRRNWKCHPLH